MLAAGYSLNDWLDLTHCGYLIFKDDVAYYRNASSKKDKLLVVDVPLVEYIANQNFSSKYNSSEIGKQRTIPGLLIYRTLDPKI